MNILHAQSHLHSTALETAANAIIITDSGGTILWVNPAFTAQTGYASSEAIGRTPRFLKSGLHDAAFYREFWKTILSGKTWRGEFRNRRKDGTLCTDEHTVTPVRSEQGKVTHFIGIMHDVTARKQAEEALRASELRFREMMENVEMIAVSLDMSATITFCNDYLLRLTGWARPQVMGHNWFELFIPETNAALRKLFFDTVELGTFPSHYENPIQTKKGGLRHIAWNNIILRDGAGNRVGIASLGEDITERLKHEKLALRSQRLEAIGTLASGVAHDLNNALAPIMMGVQLLRMDYPGESQILDMFEVSARRGADMVRQLLTFAKGAEGERVLIQPAHLIKELKRIITSSFPKNIKLVVNCETKGGLPNVRGDVTQLHQLLLNLCVNARDAMPHGGILTIEAQRLAVDAAYASSNPDANPGDYVVLRVRDTGMGIAPEILDRIFDPFFTTKGPDKGTGLGLSTALGVVKGHGGFLHVCSEPGHGSTFTAHLPAESAIDNHQPNPQTGSEFRGNGETILLVDDEPAVREMARAVLRHLNFKPLTAADGADGLIKTAEHRTELRAIITDLHMPHMEGLAFVQALRRILPDIPVMVASGRMEDALAAQFETLGVTSRLDKPFTELELAEALKSLLAPRSTP